MDLNPFSQKSEGAEGSSPDEEKKIEFSQKLAREDLEGASSRKGGDFDFLKGMRERREGEAVPVAMADDAELAAEDPAAEPKKENWFAGLFGKINRRLERPGRNSFRVPEVNLVKGEIVKYFDWQKGSLIILVSVFASLTVISLAYWGISWWGASKQSAESAGNQQKYYDTTRQIKDLEPRVNEVLKFKERLDAANYLLARHIYWTNFFNFLENNTLSNVYFSSFSGGLGGSYSFSATADSLDSIDGQVKKLQANPLILSTGVSAGSVSGGAGKPVVTFNLPLTLDPKIFLQP